MPDESTERSALEVAEQRRAERKAEARKAYEVQRAKDLDAITDLEVEHGDSNVGVINVPFTEGLPTAVACKCPSPALVKRFRDRVKPKKDGHQPDAVFAAEEIAGACRIFPDAETYAALCQARPGLAAQLGAKAIELATGRDESEGKG